MTDIASVAAGLNDDGDTVQLSETESVRLRIVPDSDTSISDFDCYGKIEFVGRYVAYPKRPQGFDGNAEKLWTAENGSDAFWWQPPTGDYAGPKRGTPEFDKFRSQVIDLVTYGFSGFVVERLRGEDSYGAAIVVDHASLWGIECFPDPDYVKEIVSDLLSEIGVGE